MTNKFIKDGASTLENYLQETGKTGPVEKFDSATIAGIIDHTILKADAKISEVEQICKEAIEYNFKSVCVNPYMVPHAANFLKGSKSLVCTVIGFPLGASSSETKAFETEDAIKNGADEIDMVLNVGALKSKEYAVVENDIKAVVKAAKGKLVKVILEVCLLTPEEIKLASEISINGGANYVKTSTGFSTGGATVEAITIMRDTVGDALGVKASGGVRDKEGLIAMVNAGATRIGASAGIAIISGKTGSSSY